MVLRPEKLALVSQYGLDELVPRIEKAAADENGRVTLHSAVKSLTLDLLVKHAEHNSTMLGLALLKELATTDE